MRLSIVLRARQIRTAWLGVELPLPVVNCIIFQLTLGLYQSALIAALFPQLHLEQLNRVWEIAWAFLNYQNHQARSLFAFASNYSAYVGWLVSEKINSAQGLIGDSEFGALTNEFYFVNKWFPTKVN